MISSGHLYTLVVADFIEKAWARENVNLYLVFLSGAGCIVLLLCIVIEFVLHSLCSYIGVL